MYEVYTVISGWVSNNNSDSGTAWYLWFPNIVLCVVISAWRNKESTWRWGDKTEGKAGGNYNWKKWTEI